MRVLSVCYSFYFLQIKSLSVFLVVTIAVFIQRRITRLERTWPNILSAVDFGSRSSSSIKMGTRRIVPLNELSALLRVDERRTINDNSRRIISLGPSL